MYHRPRPQTKPSELVLSKENISRISINYHTKHQELSKFVFHTSTLSLLRDENYLCHYISYTSHKQRTPVLQTLHFQKLHLLPFGGACSKAGRITCPLPNGKGNTKKFKNLTSIKSTQNANSIRQVISNLFRKESCSKH